MKPNNAGDDSGLEQEKKNEIRRANIRFRWHACYVCAIHDTVRGFATTELRFMGEGRPLSP